MLNVQIHYSECTEALEALRVEWQKEVYIQRPNMVEIISSYFFGVRVLQLGANQFYRYLHIFRYRV